MRVRLKTEDSAIKSLQHIVLDYTQSIIHRELANYVKIHFTY